MVIQTARSAYTVKEYKLGTLVNSNGDERVIFTMKQAKAFQVTTREDVLAAYKNWPSVKVSSNH